MTPEERAKETADTWSKNNYLETPMLLEDFILRAIRAAVEAERAKYTKAIEAADTLANDYADLAEVIEEEGLGPVNPQIFAVYTLARKDLP